MLCAGRPGLRLPHRPGLGRAPRVERQPGARRRALLTGWRLLAAASCCCPARSCSAAGESLHVALAVRLLGRRARRARRPASTATCGPGPQHPRAPRPVLLNTWEAVLLRPRPRHAAGARRAGRGQLGLERFVLDDGWFLGRRDDRAPRRLDVDARRVARRPRPAGRPRARARHGLRALVRAGDGQPRLRPRPRAPGLDLRDRPRPGPRRRGTSTCSTSATRRRTTTCSSGCPRSSTEYRIDYHQVGPQPGPARRRPHGPTGAPGVHGQTAGVYRLMAELRSRHPGLEIESCAAAAAASTSASCEHADRVWSRTATTRTSGTDPALDGAAAAARAAGHPHRAEPTTPPAGRTPRLPRGQGALGPPGRRVEPDRASDAELRRGWRPGSRSTRSTATLLHSRRRRARRPRQPGAAARGRRRPTAARRSTGSRRSTTR